LARPIARARLTTAAAPPQPPACRTRASLPAHTWLLSAQVYLPKETETQTAITSGTEAPRMVNYIKGLRGHPDSEMHIVNLTIDPGAAKVTDARRR
jgi:hypothetical protein